MIMRRMMVCAALALVLAAPCTAAESQLGRGDRYSGLAWATRSPVLAQHGMAATEQPLASQIAIDILKKGRQCRRRRDRRQCRDRLDAAGAERHRRRSLRHRLGSRDQAALRL